MFTGIVEEIGVIRKTHHDRLTIEARDVLEGTNVGDSVAVNGVCLTVNSLGDRGFIVNVMPETLRRSNLGELRYGDKVNLERALMVGGRLGGHFVLGHVDDIGRVEAITHEREAAIMEVSISAKLMPYMVDKGFIAVDGVSLTIADISDSSVTISLVIYTLENTILGERRPGNMVNLEAAV